MEHLSLDDAGQPQYLSFKGDNLSKGAKTAIGVGIAVAVVVIRALAVRAVCEVNCHPKICKFRWPEESR